MADRLGDQPNQLQVKSIELDCKKDWKKKTECPKQNRITYFTLTETQIELFIIH